MAGDIGSALPYRTMVNILNFIQAVDEIVPGFAGEETLLYAPEIKFYSNRCSWTRDSTVPWKACTAWEIAPDGRGG